MYAFFRASCYSSFTLKAIIRLGVVYEKIIYRCSNLGTVVATLFVIGCHEELVFVAAFRNQLRFLV